MFVRIALSESTEVLHLYLMLSDTAHLSPPCPSQVAGIAINDTAKVNSDAQ